MVEKAGHKKRLAVARNEWINEGRRTSHAPDDDLEQSDNEGEPRKEPENPSRAAHFTAAVAERPKTPAGDIPDDDDIYDATPTRRNTAGDVPEEDDLDALIAEAEANELETSRQRNMPRQQPTAEPDEDELDALIAEAESEERVAQTAGSAKEKDKGEQKAIANDELPMEEMDGLW